MKKIIAIITGIALLSGTANADEAEKTGPEKACEAIQTTARVAMTGRQAGIGADMMLAAANDPEYDEKTKHFMEGIILDAYQSPLFSTEENKAEAISEFENKNFVACMVGMRAIEDSLPR